MGGIFFLYAVHESGQCQPEVGGGRVAPVFVGRLFCQLFGCSVHVYRGIDGDCFFLVGCHELAELFLADDIAGSPYHLFVEWLGECLTEPLSASFIVLCAFQIENEAAFHVCTADKLVGQPVEIFHYCLGCIAAIYGAVIYLPFYFFKNDVFRLFRVVPVFYLLADILQYIFTELHC